MICADGSAAHKEPNPRFEVGSLISNLESVIFIAFNLVQNSCSNCFEFAINLTDLKLNSIIETMKDRCIGAWTNRY